MKQPPEIVYSGLRSVLGNPTDFSNNKQNNGFDRRVDIKIPTHETEQKKPVKIGPNNMITEFGGAQESLEDRHDEISNSFADNFDRMQVRSPIN